MRWSWIGPAFGCFAWTVGCVGSVDGSDPPSALVPTDRMPAVGWAGAHERGGGSPQVQANHWMNPTSEHPAPPFYDHASPLTNQDKALSMRQALIDFLWGTEGFPLGKLPSSIESDVQSPVYGLRNLERVEALHLQMAPGIESLGYHFIPLRSKRGRAVIVHQGHATTIDDDPGLDDTGFGMHRTINNLLIDGFDVVAMFMPGCLPPAAGCVSHGPIVNTPTNGHGIKFFLEPVAVYINYLTAKRAADSLPPFTDFTMVGLSGGGWTTTLYAALDERIKLSIPIAGSLPQALRTGWSIGDEEQTYAPLYQIAGYTDLYVLGGYGEGRRQVQVLNRNDDCCFGERGYDESQVGVPYNDAVRAYEADVRGRLAALRSGAFRLEIDEAAPIHTISWNTVGSVILRELHRGNASGPPALDTFFRNSKGNLAFRGTEGTEDSGIPMAGAPVFAVRGDAEFEIFIRDAHNRLNRVSKNGLTWDATNLGAVILNDPVLAVSKPSRVDVAGLTTDYLPHHWLSTAGGVSDEVVPEAPKVLGQLSLVSYPQQSGIGIFFRGLDLVKHGFLDTDVDGWVEGPNTPRALGSATSNAP